MIDNSEFFKTLNILYIDNDNVYYEEFSPTLKNFFNQVTFLTNNKEAIKKILDKKNKIDLIICDICLNDTLSVDILEAVREKDEEIPFILTTENLEIDEILLKAIKLNASDFLLKPFTIDDLISSIEKNCRNTYYKEMEHNFHHDLENVLSVINEVALVTKTNLNGNITFVNKSFCEVSGYNEAELLNQKHELIRNTNRIVSEEISQTIRSGNIWEGKMKNITKNKEDFYVYLTVIPLFDEKNIKEFIWIRFLSTEYEVEQKNFKKKVAKNIHENRRINTQARDEIDALLNKLSTYKNLDSLIKEEEERNAKFISQLAYFEKQSNIDEEKLKEITSKAKRKINMVVSEQKETRILTDQTSLLLDKQISEFQLKDKTAKELVIELNEQKKIIDKLNLKIDNREYKLGLKD